MDLLIISNNLKRASFRQRIQVYIGALESSGISCEIRQLPSGNSGRRELFKKAADFDAVFLHKKCLNFFDAKCLRKYSKKTIYDFDDAVMYSALHPENNRTSHYRLFRRTVKFADMIIAGNSYLAEHALPFNPNVKILPTGLDTKPDRALLRPFKDDRIRLVWIGSESTLPYLESIKPALEQIGKRFKNVVLRIICDKFIDLDSMEVERIAWSEETQNNDLINSDIGLAPTPDDRFTRGKCGFKILQYAAAGLPVLVSPVGVNEDFVQPGITGCFAHTIEEWVDRLCFLIEDKQLRDKMGNANLDYVKNFDIEYLGRRFVEIVTNCMSKRRPKVSICIPTYNRKEYLKQTLESVYAQTYGNLEVVVLDDGSTDGTGEMLVESGWPLKYAWQENKGDAAARNVLIGMAEGEYISFLDSDDMLFPDSIEMMVNAIPNDAKNTIIYGPYTAIDSDGKPQHRKRKKLYSGNITEQLFENILVHTCGSLFPKDKLESANGFDESLPVCSDYDLWLRLSLDCEFTAINRPMFKRRRHPDNLSAQTFANRYTEYEVVKNFYYKKGGDKVIASRLARKRIGKEAYRAGRHALCEDMWMTGQKLFGESLTRYPNLKSLFWYSYSVCRSCLNRDKEA